MSAFGSVTNLTAGTATFNKSAGQQYFWIANNDTQPITLTYKDASSNTLGQEILVAATVTGAQGGRADSVGYPVFLDATSVVVTSTLATAQISSGASTRVPTYIAFVQPSSQRGS